MSTRLALRAGFLVAGETAGPVGLAHILLRVSCGCAVRLGRGVLGGTNRKSRKIPIEKIVMASA